MKKMAKTLLVEPFCIGSHKQLIDLLHTSLPECAAFTLPGKKWPWKARTSALWLSQEIPKNDSYRTLFASSVLNLAELIALRPDLANLHKVLYFHENQLIYPVRNQKERDFQFGYNQIVSCLAADIVLFNSKYNMESFLGNINSFLKLIPDHRPKGIPETLRPKCSVLNFPVLFPVLEKQSARDTDSSLMDKNEARELGSELHVVGGGHSGQIIDSADDINHSVKIHVLEQNSGEPVIHDRLVQNRNNESPTRTSCIENTKAGVKNSENVGETLHCLKSLEQSTAKNDINETSFNDPTDSDNQSGESSGCSVPVKQRKISPNDGPLHIVWPHRWEHDKDPDLFFRVILKLKENGLDFRLSVLGETFQDVPAVFEESRALLGDKILNWGYQPFKEAYYDVLRSADCVVSTAKHEFFGVAMLEAAHLGCYPVCPNQLVYPEIFPKECLYNTEQQLYKMLREFCKKPYLARSKRFIVDTHRYSWDALKAEFANYLKVDEYS